MSLPERCRKPGCTRNRTRFSVFCDEHHRQELVRVGLAPEKEDPCAEIIERCRDCVGWFERGLTTTDELLNAIFDALVNAGTHDQGRCFKTCFESLPTPVLADLLTFVKGHPEPRLFHPLPKSAADRAATENAARAAQAEIVRALEEQLFG